MSEERVVTKPSGGDVSLADAIANDPEEHQRLRKEKKAKLVRILERGMVADRLKVDLPDDVYGEWVPNDKAEIYRMQLLGFEVDRQYAVKRALHDQGDSSSVVGDTIFMVCSGETKEILDEIRRENFEAMNGKPGSNAKTQREEQEFTQPASKIGMPVVEESRQRVARKAELEAALRRQATPPGATPIK